MPVSFSSSWGQTQRDTRPRLDGYRHECWTPDASVLTDLNQWIQVSSPVKKQWIGVETQGKGWLHQWVKSYKVVYSNDGVYWDEVDNGKIFTGNNDQNTHVKHWFDEPVWARTIRLVPKSWNRVISLRLDFIYAGH